MASQLLPLQLLPLLICICLLLCLLLSRNELAEQRTRVIELEAALTNQLPVPAHRRRLLGLIGAHSVQPHGFTRGLACARRAVGTHDVIYYLVSQARVTRYRVVRASHMPVLVLLCVHRGRVRGQSTVLSIARQWSAYVRCTLI